LTQEEQFGVINQPDYFSELKEKINTINKGMRDLEATAPEIMTAVNEVPVVVSFISANEGRVRVGQKDGGAEPIYDWTFPVNWLAPTQE
jgi:hypothetical protein